MNWPESLKSRIVSELKGYDVYFSPPEVPHDIAFPSQWLDFGFKCSEKEYIPAAWSEFAERLPWVVAWLDKFVLGTVLAVGDSPCLMYVFSEEGALYFYRGGAPLGAGLSEVIGNHRLPAGLSQFYSSLHNGFGFYIGGTMGPSRVEDFVAIKDLCDDDYPALPDMLGVFSNGGGDYLALGKGVYEGEVFIWWHESPESPTPGIDLWDVMEAWISIFLENADANGDFQP
ncbi:MULTISPECIES: hypothetical protein [Pseudomonas]|uniref:hypothetical protein n=1 Tax=Pseudomonas TaxID=286 RepID=UPI002DB80B0D|nr:hypothetical protein [Pseudomonas asiatica]MEB6589204.1 hypothetical protein [Pseudomonas asiatica]